MDDFKKIIDKNNGIDIKKTIFMLKIYNMKN